MESTKVDSGKLRYARFLKEVGVYLIAIVFFYGIADKTDIEVTPTSLVSSRVIASLLDLKEVLPEKSAIWHSWSYGYAISDITGRATFNDGGGLVSEKEYFISKGYVVNDQKALSDIIHFISTEGVGGAAWMRHRYPQKDWLKEIHMPYSRLNPPVFLLFTDRMIEEYPSIYYRGNWDFKRRKGSNRGYDNRTCSRLENNELTCTNAKIDLENGTVNNRIKINNLIFVSSGRVAQAKQFFPGGIHVQVLMTPDHKVFQVQFLEDEVFFSNFNQMYMLGRFDPNLFEEVYNKFPTARAFLVK